MLALPAAGHEEQDRKDAGQQRDDERTDEVEHPGERSRVRQCHPFGSEEGDGDRGRCDRKAGPPAEEDLPRARCPRDRALRRRAASLRGFRCGERLPDLCGKATSASRGRARRVVWLTRRVRFRHDPALDERREQRPRRVGVAAGALDDIRQAYLASARDPAVELRLRVGQREDLGEPHAGDVPPALVGEPQA